MTRDEAIKASRNGAIAAFISGALTLIVALLAIAINAQGEFAFLNDPAMLFDAVLIFICAFGMLRQSRFAAVFIFIYFILSKIIISIEMGPSAGGLIVGLIFLYFFGKAIQGSFAFHKIEKSENPDYKAPSKIVIAIGVTVSVIFFAAVILGTMTMTDMFPSTDVLEKGRISADTIYKLKATGIVEEGDEIEYFYSDAPTDILDAGNMLTSTRVITYYTDENDELLIYELFFSEITSVSLEQEGNYLNDSIYRVSTQDNDRWISIVLSTEARGDVKFVEALRKKIRLNN
jgi:hypothetical protein